MSLLRRKRRQNRLLSQYNPATREARSSLESSQVRGLRNFIGRKVFNQREKKRPIAVINLPLDPLGPEFERELRQARDVLQQTKIRQRVGKETRKPLETILLNREIRVDLPPEHPICVQREIRREVMFATRRAGKGGQRPRARNNNITLRCK